MNNVVFSDFKIRASAMPAIMTTSRKAGEELSETCKDWLNKIWIRDVWDREELDLSSKYTDKGISCEADSFDLVQRVLGTTYFKNNKNLQNDWVQGTPDIIDDPEKIIKDIKSSWNMRTYLKVDQAKAEADYNYNMQTYMWLRGFKKAELIYCLVNTPEEIIQAEAYRESFKHPELDSSEEAMKAFRRNYIFDDVPEKYRVKKFTIEFDPTFPDKAQKKIYYAREYLNNLSLT